MAREVKDAKDLSTGNLIYFKSHAKATYMSDGRTVEDAINKGSNGEENANVLKFTDVIANTWVEDATYSDFGYKCDISCEGVTTDVYAEVVFNVALATSGNYSPVCETGNSIVTIWSSVTDSITIPTIIIVE